MTSRQRYAIQIKRSAEKEMNRLPPATFDRIAAAILALEMNRGHAVAGSSAASSSIGCGLVNIGSYIRFQIPSTLLKSSPSATAKTFISFLSTEEK
jgi:hypothetical protein